MIDTKRPILFIDRDGTMIAEPEDFQIDSFEKFELEPAVVTTLNALKAAGYALVMVSNQDGLGTESFPYENFIGPQTLLLRILASEGVVFNDILICPHKPDDHCECRKPKTALVKPYLEEGVLDLDRSFVIGDRQTALQLDAHMGIKGIQYNRASMGWTKIGEQLLTLLRDRVATVTRQTAETTITITVNLDGNARQINTGVGFFDHMLDQIAVHAGIGLEVNAQGDLRIDDHHLIEDVGLVLGEALKKALGDKRGINRFGFMLPMDETLAQCALDLSGRPYFVYEAKFKYQKVGDMSTEMIEHFFRSLAMKLDATLHMKSVGQNDHHVAEGLFKCFGRSLREAIRITGNQLPTSKGVL